MKRLLRRRARPKCDCEYQSAFGPCADLHLRRPALVIQRGARLTKGALPAGSSHMSLITGGRIRRSSLTRENPLPDRFSSYGDGEDKWRIHAAGNHFILSRSQWCFITAEMIPDGLAVDDRSKRASQVAHKIISVAPLDHEMVAR